MEATIIQPLNQAKGAFDAGKITEQKPIGFSGEGSLVNRLGPLFYWAWAQSQGPAEIGMHPHKGFEIITYVIKGNGYHRDTLGTESVVGEGGAQLMQTGSGVYHAEAMKEPTELFQIWFEPHLSQAVNRPPSYKQYDSGVFSVKKHEDVEIKTILGNDSPMEIVTDAQMWDILIQNGAVYTHRLAPNRTLAGLAIRGDGSLHSGENQIYHFEHKDFVVIQYGSGEDVAIHAKNKELRLFLIEVPTEVEYPLYRKPE